MGKEKKFDGPSRLELKLVGQPTKVFNSGYELYNYAAQNNPKMEFEEKKHSDKPYNKKNKAKVEGKTDSQ
jgi:hypothetical protein